MKEMKRGAKKAAVRIWCAISRGVNRPSDCWGMSDWLAKNLSDCGVEDWKEVSDLIWNSFRWAYFKSYYGIWNRPLGSPFFPEVADIVDIGFYYRERCPRVLRALNKGLKRWCFPSQLPPPRWIYSQDRSEARLTDPESWGVGVYTTYAHDLVEDLANRIREGRAPLPKNIKKEMFEEEDPKKKEEEEQRQIAEDREIRERWPAHSLLEPALRRTFWECPKSPTLVLSLEGREFSCGGWTDYGHSNITTDGAVTTPARQSDSSLKEHEWRKKRVAGGTYVAYWSRHFGNDTACRYYEYDLKQLYLTPEAEPETVRQVLKEKIFY